MRIHKDLISFKGKVLQTEEGRMSQTKNPTWKKLSEDIKKNGIINPLICTEKDGRYTLYIGARRFIAGCLLGIKEYEVKTVPGEWPNDTEKVKILTDACKKYIRIHKNGEPLAI